MTVVSESPDIVASFSTSMTCDWLFVSVLDKLGWLTSSTYIWVLFESFQFFLYVSPSGVLFSVIRLSLSLCAFSWLYWDVPDSNVVISLEFELKIPLRL